MSVWRFKVPLYLCHMTLCRFSCHTCMRERVDGMQYRIGWMSLAEERNKEWLYVLSELLFITVILRVKIFC